MRDENDVLRDLKRDISFLKAMGIDNLESKIGFFYIVDKPSAILKYIEELDKGYLTLLSINGNREKVRLRGNYERSVGRPSIPLPKWFNNYPFLTCEYSGNEVKPEEELEENIIPLGIHNFFHELGFKWLKLNPNRSRLNGIILFPLYIDIEDAFLRGDKELVIYLKTSCEHFLSRVKLRVLLSRGVAYSSQIVDGVLLPVSGREITYNFAERPRDGDEVEIRILLDNIGTISHGIYSVLSLKAKRDPRVLFLKRIVKDLIDELRIGSFLSPGKDVGIRGSNINALEFYVYNLLSTSFPLIWTGLWERLSTPSSEILKEVFRKYGLEETVDFLSFMGNKVLLIECTKKLSEDYDDKVRRLLHLKDRLSKMGFIVYPFLIIGEKFEEKKQFMKEKLYEGIHYLFGEELDRVADMKVIISEVEDLARYARRKTSEQGGILYG